MDALARGITVVHVQPDAGEAVGAILNGRWKLVRLVGEGGLAAVYEADGQQGQGKRAIKLLHSQFVTNAAVVRRFRSEAEACLSLRHPHICIVESLAYAEDGTPYMVMELLHGMSLEEYLRRKTPMPPEMAAPLLYGILQAVTAAHGRGIVHRDIKPANIFLVAQESGQYAVKVLDFGIAKVMDIAGGMGSKTRTGAVLGTPGYMSPEQVKNAKAVDARTDLWAAGVVFYEMLTCKHPFGSSDTLARMVAVLRDPPTPISKVAPQLAHWDPFFSRAMSRDPEARFQSAEQMIEGLRSFVEGTQARWVPDGLQTVAIPIMTNVVDPGPASVIQVGAAPATQGAVEALSAAAPSIQQRTSQMPQFEVKVPVVGGSVPPVSHHPSAPPPHAESMVPHVQSMSPHGQSMLPHAESMSSHAPSMVPQVPPAPRAGSRPGSSTQVSGDPPHGAPAHHPTAPHVEVLMARDKNPLALVWWGVVLLTGAAFALGMMLGYLIGYG